VCVEGGREGEGEGGRGGRGFWYAD